jgi:hypothetical protein
VSDDDTEEADAMAEAKRSLAQRALDIAVFAPTGLLLTAAEDLPALAEKGRSQLEEHVRNARSVGELVVRMGQQELERRLGRESPPPSATATETDQAADPDAVDRVVPMEPRPAPTGPTPGVPLAIPDYDTLSASQVVRRLDGLAPSELEEVARHESATRGRRTILHRVQQLLAEPDAAS